MPAIEAPMRVLPDLNPEAIVATYSSAVPLSSAVTRGSSVTLGSAVIFGIQQELYPTSLPTDSHKDKYKRDLFFRPRFQSAKDQLKRMENLRHDWDTYGGEPPNPDARRRAEQVLGLLETMSIPPSRLVASAEGGVAICFVENNRYADIECLNSGEVLAVTYVGTQEPLVWEVPAEVQGIQETIERIGAHFAA